MPAIINILMTPLILMNMFGGIVSGIWLAILGEWGGIGLGLLISITGAFFCGLFLIPGFLITIPAIFLMANGPILKIIGFAVGMLGLMWTYLVMSGWGVFSFSYFLDRADAGSFYPYLIWAYGVATGPWSFMASKEADDYSFFAVFFLQVAAISLIITIGFTGLSPAAIFLVFIGIMTLGYIFNIAVGGVMLLIETRQRRI